MALEPKKQLRFLVDNDLSPDIANALRLFDFDITHVQYVPEWQTEKYGVDDSTIIEWCKENDAVWITHDKRAKRRWGEDIKNKRVSVVWVRGKSEGFSAWTQLKTVVRTINGIEDKLAKARGAMHFRISVATGSQMTVDWAEHPYDIPKQKAASTRGTSLT